MSAGGDTIFLLEIGTEEIPARMIEPALRDLGAAIGKGLEGARLASDGGPGRPVAVETFGTPRRLAIRVRGVRRRQPDIEREVTGPPAKAAFDPGGRPTKAAEGFARAQGVPLESLLRIATPKGECIGVRRKDPGLEAAQVLQDVVPAAVSSLSFPKMMRWGSGDFRFVRPIHWIVAVLDGAVVDFGLAGIRSGRCTRGHRLRGNVEIDLGDPMTYEDRLRAALVEPVIARRRELIEAQCGRIARAAGAALAAPPGSPRERMGDPALLEEMVQSVEWPLVVEGEFDAAHLDLPEEILVTALRHHQKSFALRRPDGRLLNRFLAVADTEGDPRGAIRRGNEWVLRARLADARFFWSEDRKRPLERHAEGLGRVTFHDKLGSYARKTERMAALAPAVTSLFARAGRKADAGVVAAALRLCKADLTTQMVNEFPELEGVVGGLYARADGLPEPVATAIYSHYLPRGTDDPIPPTPEGAIVTLIDRLDTQSGIFRLGLVPTGSRDPYGLRRSVLGACRILIESGVHASLATLLETAGAGHGEVRADGCVSPAEATGSLLEFYRGRLQFLGESSGLRQDSVRAALASSMDDPRDAWLRMRALDAIRGQPQFASLALLHKRIKNILKDRGPAEFTPALLVEEAEKGLERALRAAGPAIDAAQSRPDHLQALKEIAALAPALDRFFAEVLVLAPDTRLRDNRLALLQGIGRLFLRVGDFSEITVEGETAQPRRARAGTAAGEAGAP